MKEKSFCKHSSPNSPPPLSGKAHTMLKTFALGPSFEKKLYVHVQVNYNASSRTSRPDCNFPTLCQRLEFMCTLTWSLFPFPVQLTCLLFRRANAHWVTRGQRSNTWKKSQQTNTQGEHKTYLAGGAFRNNIFLYNYVHGIKSLYFFSSCSTSITGPVTL